MKLALSTLLCASVALADPAADAPVADLPSASVLVHKGDQVPFDGRLLSLDENLRRGRSSAECKATLADAEGNGVLMPKAAVAALISAGAAAVVTSIVLGLALAAKHQ